MAKFIRIVLQSLFANTSAEEIVNSLLTIDLTTGVNKKLKKMIGGSTASDTEIENQLYAMIKKMRTNKVTKQVVKMKFCKKSTRDANVGFGHGGGNGFGGDNEGFGGGGGFGGYYSPPLGDEALFSCDVNQNGTMKQLIAELNDKLKVWNFTKYINLCLHSIVGYLPVCPISGRRGRVVYQWTSLR